VRKEDQEEGSEEDHQEESREEEEEVILLDGNPHSGGYFHACEKEGQQTQESRGLLPRQGDTHQQVTVILSG